MLLQSSKCICSAHYDVLILIPWTLSKILTIMHISLNHLSWLIDRLATMSNIAGDLAVTAVVSNKVTQQ